MSSRPPLQSATGQNPSHSTPANHRRVGRTGCVWTAGADVLFTLSRWSRPIGGVTFRRTRSGTRSRVRLSASFHDGGGTCLAGKISAPMRPNALPASISATMVPNTRLSVPASLAVVTMRLELMRPPQWDRLRIEDSVLNRARKCRLPPAYRDPSSVGSARRCRRTICVKRLRRAVPTRPIAKINQNQNSGREPRRPLRRPRPATSTRTKPR
jgi:hypothetical protein